jgi:hypothetical protein
MRKFGTVGFILVFLASAFAAPQPDTLAKRFVGAWQLVSVEGNPPGRPAVYDVQIVVKADRPPFAPYTQGMLSATTAEKAAAFDSYAAFFGTYTVNAKEGTVTHHLEDNLVPGRRGTDNVRWFEFRGDDQLLLVPVEDGKGGVLARKDATYKLLWRRIK